MYKRQIDPLDGTTNFSNGLPVFGSSISFVFNYQTVVSALFIPSIENINESEETITIDEPTIPDTN